MYSDEILETKWKVQRRLAAEAESEGRPYPDIVEAEARRIFEQRGWTFRTVRLEPRSHNAEPQTAPK